MTLTLISACDPALWREEARSADPLLLVEDVLLLLFQRDSGTIAGENILFYVLGGAVLGDLALTERVEIRSSGVLSRRVHALGDAPIFDDLIKPARAYVTQKPHSVQTVLAAIGPTLRGPVLDRVVEREDLNREKGKMLGIFPSTTLTLASGRRAELMRRVAAIITNAVIAATILPRA